MDIKCKQHILPESYLKHWVDPATEVPGKTPMLWTITKDARKKRPRPPASGHFWRDYFYDLISTSGERRQNLENILAKIEGGVAKTIEQRILQRHPLDQAEAANLDLFVACMFMRTEKMKDSITSGVSAMAHIEKDNARFHGTQVPNTSVMEHNAHAHAIYEGLLFISGELAKRSHNVFVAPAGKAYVTSDTPCTWQAPLGCVGLVNPMLEVTIPLTSRHLLHISKTIPTSSYIDASDFWVDQTNWEIIRRCRKYFIANSQTVEPSWLESETYWGLRLLKWLAR
jgi:hypothetical protein